jgi:hypothetical protein
MPATPARGTWAILGPATMLPFTIDQFFGVFAAYNLSIWPAQVVAYGVATLALSGIVARRPWGGRVAASMLTIFWLWNGIAYHLFFFSAINPAAYLFGAAFILQGLLFFAYGVVADRLALRFRGGWHGALALALIVHAAVAYEVLGHFTGHGWPRAPLFGVAPCPTTIFTFGLLLLSIRPLPVLLLAIPLLWAAIGSTAAVLLGVPEDLGLAVAALMAAALLPFWGFREPANVMSRRRRALPYNLRRCV